MNGDIYYIDRIAGERIICEDRDGNTVTFAKSTAEGELTEGDCVRMVNGKIIVDSKATSARRNVIKQLESDIFCEE